MNGKDNYTPVIIIGAIFAAGGAACAIVGFAADVGVCKLIGIVLAFTGVIMLITSFVNRSKQSAGNANLSDPNSLAYKTYGGGGDYVYFPVYPNRKAQVARNAVVNTLGVLGMLLGGGMFMTGMDILDAFVNEHELILNSRSKNGRYDDDKFTRITADRINSVDFESVKKYERVTVTFDGENKLYLDVPVSLPAQAERVREVFSVLSRSVTAENP